MLLEAATELKNHEEQRPVIFSKGSSKDSVKEAVPLDRSKLNVSYLKSIGGYFSSIRISFNIHGR
jgi:hypothetical protein